ncbi:hypothetical protein ACFXA2_24775, partial [Micromonospora chalcea]
GRLLSYREPRPTWTAASHTARDLRRHDENGSMEVIGVTVPANVLSSDQRAAGMCRSAPQTAVAIGLGSSSIGVWAAHRGTISAPCGDASTSAGSLIRRGCIVDADGCVILLSHLIRLFSEPVPPAVSSRPAARS